MYILLSTPAAFILLVYSIYKWIMRQSDREKEFWIDQKVYGHPVSLKLYALMKAVLFLIAIGGVMLILVSWRSHADSGFIGIWSSSDLAGFLQQKISLGGLRCRLFHHCAIRFSGTDPIDPACRQVQHRKSDSILSADRNHHRHTARRNLHRRILSLILEQNYSSIN